MISLAVISDVHGNLPALEAVLADIVSQGITDIYHLGDLVGYNPFPNETVALIEAAQIPGIIGNYDQAVLGGVKDPVTEFLNAKITPMGREIYSWTVREVNRRSREHNLVAIRDAPRPMVEGTVASKPGGRTSTTERT